MPDQQVVINKKVGPSLSIKAILFVVWPFGAFLLSFANIKSRSSAIIVYLFFVLFGFSFNADFESADSYRYREQFERMHRFSLYDFIEGFWEYTEFDEGEKDYYFKTVAFVISRVTDNYHILFAFVAAIFGLFYLKSLSFLTKEDEFDYSILSWLLLFLLVISNPIFNINGIRFWTASWVGVYCIFQIYLKKDYRYFALALATPLIHVAFWSYVVLLVLTYWTKKHHRLMVGVFAVSFFVANLSTEFFRSLVSYLPSFIARALSNYLDPNYITLREDMGFYTEIFKITRLVFINLTMFLFIKNHKDVSENERSGYLYTFLLAWLSFTNFVMPVPSYGSRFIMLGYPVIAYLWLVNFKGKKYDYFLATIPFVFSFDIVILFFQRYPKYLEIDLFFLNIVSLIVG